MTNELTTKEATSHDVGAVLSPVLSWTTKTGKTRAAFTEATAARGNRAARLAGADAATVKQLQNNTYKPFLRDVSGKLTTAHIAGLKASVQSALAVEVEGVPMLPAGDVLAQSNKKVALAVVAWLQSPTAVVKGATVAKPLPKSAQYLADIAQAWADSAEAPTGEDDNAEAPTGEDDNAEAPIGEGHMG